jgi:hypothetical protein
MFWDAQSPSQEMPCLLQNPKVHYDIHNSLPLVPLKNLMNQIHILTL